LSGNWSHYEKAVISDAELNGSAPREVTVDGLPLYRVSPPGHGASVKPPSILHQEDPEYDEQDRQAKVSGIVLLEIIIDPEGKPKDIQLVSGLTPGLEASALKAVRGWIFRPATKNGQPVAVLSNVEVNFQLR
jgi:TonB family protein